MSTEELKRTAVLFGLPFLPLLTLYRTDSESRYMRKGEVCVCMLIKLRLVGEKEHLENDGELIANE